MGGQSTLLLAEDDPVDALLLERAFRRHDIPLSVQRVAHGEELIQYLRGVGVYGDRAKHPYPCVLMLDLKMPGMDGFDVLAWRQKSPELHTLPVIVFSSSSLDKDIRKAYELGANSYVVKSVVPTDLKEMVDALYWWWCRFNATAQP